jgi:hypothetical protein
MIRFLYIFVFIIIGLLFIARYSIANSSLINEGVIEGIQACEKDEDCKWVITGCCACELGGKEMLINRKKETVYKILVKPLCLQEVVCKGEDMCHYEEVYCDKVCKFGKRKYSKPLLLR